MGRCRPAFKRRFSSGLQTPTNSENDHPVRSAEVVGLMSHTGMDTMSDKLEDAIELARIGAGVTGYKSYPGTGGVWAGANGGVADITFVDWGLARATAEILNAVLDGRLTSAQTEGAEVTSISNQLWALCDPMAEALGDKDRIDRFVKVGREAAALIAELDAFVAAHQYTLDANPPALWPKDSVLSKAVTRHEARTSTDQSAAKI
jgi:hypothetical protein